MSGPVTRPVRQACGRRCDLARQASVRKRVRRRSDAPALFRLWRLHQPYAQPIVGKRSACPSRRAVRKDGRRRATPNRLLESDRPAPAGARSGRTGAGGRGRGAGRWGPAPRRGSGRPELAEGRERPSQAGCTPRRCSGCPEHRRRAGGPADLVRLVLGDFLRDQVGRVQRPGDADEGVVFRDAGALARQPAVRTVGVAAFSVILKQVDAAAVHVAEHAPRPEAEFDGGGHADAHVVGRDMQLLGLYLGG